MGRDDVFFRKVLKFVQAQNYFFRALTTDFFEIEFISYVKRKSNSTIEQQKGKGHEKTVFFEERQFSIIILFTYVHFLFSNCLLDMFFYDFE